LSCPPRVLHVLANSAPDVNGYAIRSHDLLVSLKDANICDPIVLTSPYYPHRESMFDDAQIDGIEYHRSTSQKKKRSSSKHHGFNIPKSKPLIVRSFKFVVYKIKLILKKFTRPLYRSISMFLRFLGEKKMMKVFEK
jgi:hypothetical protein